MRRLFPIAMFVLLFGAPAFGQGCAMCKANVAAAPPATQAALRRGILTLLLPSLGVVAGLGVVVWKHRE
jgi:hypothetical protein